MTKIKQQFGAEIRLVNGHKNLVYNSDAYFLTRISKMPLGKVTVTIDNNKPSRSNNQNRFLHGVCFPEIANLTGYTETEAKAICVNMFIPKKIINFQGKDIEVRKGTSELTVNEAVEFTESVMLLAVELGGKIPTPCEVGYFCGRRECDICSQEIEKVGGVDYPENNLGEANKF